MEYSELLNACKGNVFAAEILKNRGFDDIDNVEKLLDTEKYMDQGYGEFYNMGSICETVCGSIRNGEKICIYGDYDTDGICSTAILYDYLCKTKCNILYHIPDRFDEGYGMNMKVIEELYHMDVKLVITCDTGISNLDEIKYARSLGMKVIITDHHELPGTIPECEGILNPKMLGESSMKRNICGTAVAYYFVCGLDDLYFKRGGCDDYLDLVFIATIGDVVPVLDCNRYLLKKGLPVLRNTGRKGLVELFHISRLDMSTFTYEDIGYQIVPRINACGRLEKGEIALALLLCDDYGKAFSIAKRMNLINEKRKAIQSDIINQAEALVQRDKNIIVLYNKNWHQGIIGIAASRICEDTGKPVLLMSLKDDNRTVTGSMRSVPHVSAIDILKACGKNLIKYGGHKGAAGFSLDVENVDLFIQDVEEYGKQISINKVHESQWDIEVNASDMGEELYNGIMLLSPFGEGFEEPKMLVRGIRVYSERPISDGSHKKLVVGDDSKRVDALWWHGGSEKLKYDLADVVFYIRQNVFKGKTNIELLIIAICESQYSKVSKCCGKNIMITDLRGKEGDIPAGCIYYEGVRNIEGSYSRYEAVPCDTLVMLSIPPRVEILRELIIKTNPDMLILAFKYSEENINTYLRCLAGIIKAAYKRQDSAINIYEICAATNQSEETVKASLEYLIERGQIDCSIDKCSITINSILRSPVKAASKNTEKHFTDSFREDLSFKQYMMGVSLDDIHTMIE